MDMLRKLAVDGYGGLLINFNVRKHKKICDFSLFCVKIMFKCLFQLLNAYFNNLTFQCPFSIETPMCMQLGMTRMMP